MWVMEWIRGSGQGQVVGCNGRAVYINCGEFLG